MQFFGWYKGQKAGCQGSTACSDPARAELLAAAGRQQAACAYSSYFKFRPSAGSLLLSETLDLVRALYLDHVSIPDIWGNFGIWQPAHYLLWAAGCLL